MINDDRVCALVVTYNRKTLLRECLHALLAQTHAVGRIMVVDNVSTDGTAEMLLEEFAPAQLPQVEVVRLATNGGGAGGFHEGMKRAAAAGYAWLWLMDDDTIPEPTALAALLETREAFAAENQPDLLASKVIWTDGSMHPLNIPRLKRNDSLVSMCRAAEHGAISLRSSSFVSLLMSSRFVEQYGLPFADYFIWNDDVEYTARILRNEFGVLVPRSIVLHKTTKKVSEPGWKFYYGLRNSLWMIRRSNAWSGQERLERLFATISETFTYLSGNFALAKLRLVARALVAGLFSGPVK